MSAATRAPGLPASNGVRLTLGTAGHIDHGKTRLVVALTGTDTDRLPEEKRRGISIALGYADLALPNGSHLSVIDVPGHERFVRTMLAGTTGIDLFLLVIDAGEGPKPQTLEHLEILRLLGIDRGVAVLTKIDIVDQDQLRESAAATAELLPDTELVAVSAVTGQGLPELVSALERAVASVAVPAGTGPARLHIDRSFTLPGAGQVITGTLWSGAVSVGDRLELLPHGSHLRVRNIQVHGESVERAEAGRRVALAISTQRRRRPKPGELLATPGRFAPSYRVDVALERTSLPDRAQVTVCHGTSAIPARFVRVGGRFAQLRLTRPLVTAPGDRLVLRQQSTVGGGRVLDPVPPRHPDEARLERLEAGELEALIDAPEPTDALQTRFQLSDADLDASFPRCVRAGGWICSGAWLGRLRATAEATLAARGDELDPGLPLTTLLGHHPWVGDFMPLLGLDMRDGNLYLPGQVARSGAPENLIPSGLKPFRLTDPGLGRQLERDQRLVVLGDGLALSPEAYSHYKQIAVSECEQAGTISLARFRDLAELSRKLAQLVLERLDVDRVTLRVGEVRRLRRSTR